MGLFNKDEIKTLRSDIAAIVSINEMLEIRVKELEREMLYNWSEKEIKKYKKMIGKNVAINAYGWPYGNREGKLLDLVLKHSGVIEAHLKGQGCIEVKRRNGAIRLTK